MTRHAEVIPDFIPLSISSIERIKDCISWLSPDGKLLYANPVRAQGPRLIIVMAHALNLRVVAEGIETEEQLALVNQMGCDCAQGYYFSRPLPPNEFENWVRNWQEKEGRNLKVADKGVPAHLH